jgi:hypothetical protein
MNGEDVHELHLMHVVKASEFISSGKFACQVHCHTFFFSLSLCREHKEKGEEHLVPGLKKKQFALLHNLEQARQDSKRCVKHYSYTLSLTLKVCSQ